MENNESQIGMFDIAQSIGIDDSDISALYLSIIDYIPEEINSKISYIKGEIEDTEYISRKIYEKISSYINKNIDNNEIINDFLRNIIIENENINRISVNDNVENLKEETSKLKNIIYTLKDIIMIVAVVVIITTIIITIIINKTIIIIIIAIVIKIIK